MANDITMKLKSPIEVKNRDFEIVAHKDGKKLGTMLISKGNVEWVPAGNSRNKKRAIAAADWARSDALKKYCIFSTHSFQAVRIMQTHEAHVKT
jgi:hypothetical protein